MSGRLCYDCVEASNSASGLDVYSEVEHVNVSTRWTLAAQDSPAAALSVRDAYQWLNQQERVPELRYVRVPIADETAPEENDFDQVQTLMEANEPQWSSMSPQCALMIPH